MTTLACTLVVLLVLLVASPSRRRARRRATRRTRRTASLDARSTRWLGIAVAVSFGLAAGGLGLALGAGSVAACAGPIADRVQRRRERVAVAAAVPDLVDLFVVSASAGQPVAASLAVVAPRAPPAVRLVVATAHDRFRRGLPLADCLAELGQGLGAGGAPLADALRQAAAAGVPLVPLLEGVAAAARDERRRRAQEVARRLPVTMLFPLVLCILPAAVLLAVVPVLLVSVASLRP
ncbi:MAG TPA: type II secretion system F family protein [Acidimicrobiales bacterium]|nr:type II secretion system F family protein [Acidimicrobiales bacterium]